MKTASVTETKNQLSALLDRVRGGESVVITDRGVPVARLEPVVGTADFDGRISRLERAGILRRGSGKVDLHEILRPGPELPPGVSAVEVLLEERRTGR